MGIVALLLPTRCPVCGRPGPAPCSACWARLAPAPVGVAPPPGVDRCRSLLRYDGAGRELLARLKYRNARSSLGWLAAGMASLAVRLVEEGRLEVVTWAPTSAARRRERGFDQAELLARAVGGHLALPVERLLLRRPGPPQTGRTGEDRRRGPPLVLRPGRPAPSAGARVLLIDDVMTSGATLRAAATALRGGGAEVVMAVTAGRTPLKVARGAADA